MTSGDQYNYQVIFTPKGFDRAHQATAALEGFERAMADGAKRADAFSHRADNASQAMGRFGKAAGGMGQANSRLAQGLMTSTYIIDDAAFGVRGLVNNLPALSTALFGAGAAGAAVAAGGTILVSMFKDQIDAGLEWAGILDENVAKGLRNAEGRLVSFTERLQEFREAFDEFARPVRDRADSIVSAFEDAGKESERRVAEIVAASKGIGAEIEQEQADLERKILQLQDKLAGASKTFSEGSAGYIASLQAQLDTARDELLNLGDALVERGLPLLRELQDEAANSDEALTRLSEAARDAGQKELAEALWNSTKAGKAHAEQLKAIEKINEEGAREAKRRAAEEERESQQKIARAAREAEAAEARARREAEAAEEAARRQMLAIDAARQAAEDAERDAMTNRVLKALGGRFDQGIAQALQSRTMAGQGMGAIGVGGASDDVAMQVVQQLVRSGVSVDAARGAARELVQQQADAIQAVVDSSNLNFRLNQQMATGLDALRQQQEQYRNMLIQLMNQSARRERRGRSNMLGTHRPF